LYECFTRTALIFDPIRSEASEKSTVSRSMRTEPPLAKTRLTRRGFVKSTVLGGVALTVQSSGAQTVAETWSSSSVNRAMPTAALADFSANFAGSEIPVVTVGERNGRTYNAHADRAGRGGNGMAAEPEGLWEKFSDCAGRVLTPSSLEALTAVLKAFPEFGDVRTLMRLTAVAPARRLATVDA
jgi:hypothetical protein